MKQFLITVFVFCLGMSQLSAVGRDLNSLQQDFVLETKQINIPGCPEAFNPSIVRWQGKLLMSFRTYDSDTRSTDIIGFVWLDEELNPVSAPVFLQRMGELAYCPSQAQDPRLIVVNQELYIVYSNLYPFSEPISRMFVGKLNIGIDGSVRVVSPSPMVQYPGELRNRKEKNWVPFVYENTLMLAYSLQPHCLFLPILGMNSCRQLVSTVGAIKWDWGVLRGGTPALLVDGQYLAFFHSDKAISTVQSNQQMMNHYFMGAYTFQAEYPFAITGISPYPIVDRTFYEGPMYNTWKPLRVVFPGGYVHDDSHIWLVYGRQDHEIWVAKLDKTRLMASLKPVRTVSQ